MAIIVDKVKKRKDIALACIPLFVQGGIKDLTISQVAKQAGIGKGTFYDYYKNKEAIIFEMITILMEQHNQLKETQLASVSSTRDKVKMFYNFYFNEEDKELRELYKEFLSISLSNPNEEMVVFHTQALQLQSKWLEDIIKEGINKKEIIPESIQLAKGLFCFGDGVFLNASATYAINDTKQEIENFINTLFDLIESKI